MAISVAHVQGEADTSNTTTGVTAMATSFLPVAGTTYLLIARFTAGTSISALSQAVTHGGSGLTLSHVAGAKASSQDASVNGGCALNLFVGTATGTPTTGVFTLDSGLTGTNTTSRQYELISVTGCDTTTPIPQDDTNQSNNNASSGLTATLGGAFINAGSFTLSAFSTSNGTTDPTIPTGWTSLQSRSNSLPNGRLTVAYLAGNDSTADWTGLNTGATEDLCTFIVEIAEASAGSDVLIQGLQVIDRGMLTQTAVRLGGLLQ